MCIPEATSIDTEDVTDLSCSHDDVSVKTCQPTGMCKKGTQRPDFICPLQRALREKKTLMEV